MMFGGLKIYIKIWYPDKSLFFSLTFFIYNYLFAHLCFDSSQIGWVFVAF